MIIIEISSSKNLSKAAIASSEVLTTSAFLTPPSLNPDTVSISPIIATELLVIGVANFALIYIPGLAGLALWSSYAGAPLGIIDLLMMGLVPFIAGDIVKILGAASVSKAFLPKD